MKRWVIRVFVVVSILVLLFGSLGCGKEEAVVEEPAKEEAVEPTTEQQPAEQATEPEGEEKPAE